MKELEQPLHGMRCSIMKLPEALECRDRPPKTEIADEQSVV
jgi:hypothetical protein